MRNGNGRRAAMALGTGLGWALAASYFLGAPAFAQEAAETGEASESDELVVTALRRETQLQDTPLSVAAVSGETLEVRGVDDFIDFAPTVPGFTLRDNGPGQRRPVLRGIQGAGEAQVGTYYDEFPITGTPGATNDAGRFAPDIKLVDVQRVEVLRGPQGTLFGAGSMGGTVRVVTRDPDLQDFSGMLSTDVAQIKGGGRRLGVEGALNLPIVDDRLGVRIVGYAREEGGFIDNTVLGVEDINASSTSGARITALFEPTPNFSLRGVVLYQETHADAGSASVQASGDLNANLPAYDPFDDQVALFGLTGEYDFGWATLTGNASHYRRDLFFNFLFPNLGIPFTSPTVLGTAIVQQPQSTEANTYELRLSSPGGDNALNWTFGIFSQERDAVLRSFLPFAGPNGQPNYSLPPFQDRTVQSFLNQEAAFGEISYDFGALTLTAGARWFEFDVGSQQAFFIATGGGVPASPGVYSGAPPFTESGDLYKFGASFDVSDDIMLYALYSEGFRPGGANQTVSPSIPPGFQSDAVANYEAGVKTQWFNRRLTINAAYYQMAWDSIQVDGSTPDGLFRFTTNAGQAQVDGFELEIFITPVDGLDLGLTYGHVDARLSEDQPFIPGVPRRGLEGQNIPSVPEQSLSLFADYAFPLTSELTARLRADAQYVGDSNNMFNPFLVSTTTGAPTATPDPFYAQHDGYTIANLRGSVEREGWRVQVFADNLFDERGVNFIFIDNFRPGGYTYYARPRTVGMSVSVDF